MLGLKARLLQLIEEYPPPNSNAVEVYSQIDYTSIWYQIIKASGMEEQYLSNKYIVSFHVGDDSFKKLPEDLRKQMTDPKNKEKIQKFLKHYLCYSEVAYETFVDLAEVGNIKNMTGENINIKYQVGAIQYNPPPASRKIITATANKVKFALPTRLKNGHIITLMDFFPGTLDYFK